MDRKLSHRVKIIRIAKRVGLIMVGCGCCVMLVLALQAFLTPELDRKDLVVARAVRGDIESTVTGSGIVVPEFEEVLTSPFLSKVEAVFLESGQAVTSGQSILELDKTSSLTRLQNLQDQYALISNRKHNYRLNLNKTLNTLNTETEIKRLQIAFSEEKLVQTEKLRKSGLVSENAVREEQITLEIARKELELLQQQSSNEMKLLENELHGLDLEISILSKNIEELNHQLVQTEARATRSGVVTWVKNQIGSTVLQGEVIARVADLSSFKIECQISDIHLSSVVPGAQSIIQFGEVSLRGTIEQVNPTVTAGIVNFFVTLDDKSHSRLRPNLRVDVHIITARLDDIIKVRNGPFYNGSLEQPVFVVVGNQAVRRLVQIGLSSFDEVQITSGIAAGEPVIISDMHDYHHLETISIVD